MILARVVSTFDFVLVPGQKFTLHNEVTIKAKEECKVYLTPAKRNVRMTDLSIMHCGCSVAIYRLCFNRHAHSMYRGV